MTRKFSRKILWFSLFLVCLVGVFFHMSHGQKNAPKTEIITLKPSDPSRTQITILVKYAFGINTFEKIVEEKFPDIDIVQVGDYTPNTVLSLGYEARLKNDDLTDIVITWPLEIGEEYWQDRLIDMSGIPFTSNYKTAMLDSIATKDGSLYYLPGPAQIRALVYNKTLFEENDWQVPKNYTEFLALCNEIHKTGMRSLQLSLGNPEVLDTAFIACNYGNAFSKASDIDWFDNYLGGTGNFMDHFSSALETFQELIDNDIFRREDLGLYYQNVQQNLFERKAAMVEDSVLLINLRDNFTDSDDEFALMPFFNKSPENDWARLYMTCYIGLNKHLLEQQNENKYAKVLKLMEFISTPEGQAALASDNEATYSSLRNSPAPSIAEIEDILPAINQGRYGTFPNLALSGNALRDGLAEMVNRSKTAEQVGQMIDQEQALGITSPDPPQLYGTATKDFSLIETGSFFADTLKAAAGSDFALFLDNGKDGYNNQRGLCSRIYQGDFTQKDLDRIFPDLFDTEKSKVIKVIMTGEDLLDTLQNPISINGSCHWFYYFSGLCVTFDPLAPEGERVKSVTTPDGKELDKNKEYSVAIMQGTLPEKHIVSQYSTGISVKTLIADTIQALGSISPIKDNRFIIVN